MADKNLERVVVTVDGQDPAAIQSVAQALRSAGMDVKNVLPVTGIITGEVPQSSRQALSSVPGVKAVESDDDMHAI